MVDTYLLKTVAGDCLLIKGRWLPGGVPFEWAGAGLTIGLKWPNGSKVYSSDDDGPVVLGPEDGDFELRIPGEDTMLLPFKRNTAYQIRVRDSLGCERTILRGEIDVAPAAIATEDA